MEIGSENEQAAVIGGGRLAWSLVPQLQAAGIEVVQLIGRADEGGQPSARVRALAQRYAIPVLSTGVESLIQEVSWIWLAVSDQAIAAVAEALPQGQATVIHASGSVGIEALQSCGPRVGVIYPLQIFTPATPTPFDSLPLFVEGTAQTRKRLLDLAGRLSPQVHELDSAGRLRLHLGAVWMCNFPNYLYQVAQALLPAQPGLDLSVYAPLVRAHIDKVFREHPEHTQTGPAVRGDHNTLAQHLDLLRPHPEWAALYQTLSLLINPQAFSPSEPKS